MYRFLLFYNAAFEFICAQSPHFNERTFLGTYHAIKGVFQLLGVLVIYAPITAWCKPPPNFQSVFQVLPGQCCETTDWNNCHCCKEVLLLTTMVKVEFAVYAPLFYEFLNSFVCATLLRAWCIHSCIVA